MKWILLFLGIVGVVFLVTWPVFMTIIIGQRHVTNFIVRRIKKINQYDNYRTGLYIAQMLICLFLFGLLSIISKPHSESIIVISLCFFLAVLFYSVIDYLIFGHFFGKPLIGVTPTMKDFIENELETTTIGKKIANDAIILYQFIGLTVSLTIAGLGSLVLIIFIMFNISLPDAFLSLPDLVDQWLKEIKK